MRIYITHCSAKKDDFLKCTDKKVPPDKLYTSSRIKGFMRTCKEKKVEWAIFSDEYGIWHSNRKHKWYDKHPDTIIKNCVIKDKMKFKWLLNNFDRELKDYDEIWFYYHPGRFHCLYKTLLQKTKLKDKVKQFTHKKEIE